MGLGEQRNRVIHLEPGKVQNSNTLDQICGEKRGRLKRTKGLGEALRMVCSPPAPGGKGSKAKRCVADIRGVVNKLLHQWKRAAIEFGGRMLGLK